MARSWVLFPELAVFTQYFLNSHLQVDANSNPPLLAVSKMSSSTQIALTCHQSVARSVPPKFARRSIGVTVISRRVAVWLMCSKN